MSTRNDFPSPTVETNSISGRCSKGRDLVWLKGDTVAPSKGVHTDTVNEKVIEFGRGSKSSVQCYSGGGERGLFSCLGERRG